MLALACSALTFAAPFASATPAGAFVYCTAASNSPRGQGLIVTQIFQSRSDAAFIETAFFNYLRSSYAPYGNSWVVPERSASCQAFQQRRKAEVQRALDISRVAQPTQSVFNVLFQIG